MPQSPVTGIQPFQGRVVRRDMADAVVSPAYDALTPQQRRDFRLDHPDSYLLVTRSAEDEPDGDSIDNATLVARGRKALDDLLAKDAFVSHGEPAFYVYRLTLDGHVQHGLVCEVPSTYYHRVAKPHEATRDERAALLAEHFETVGAASSPVACTASDTDGLLESALVEACVGDPLVEMVSADGLQQAVWRVDDAAFAERVQTYLYGASLFIIDGHHRSRANKQLLDRGIDLPVLAAIFPGQSLQLVGFHRILKLAGGADAEQAVLDGIARRFKVEQVSALNKVDTGQVAMVVGGDWFVVTFDERPIAGSAQVLLGALDPVVLEREILRGVVEPLAEFSISYMPDVHPFDAIVDGAAEDGTIPIFVPPVDINDMMAVAGGGQIMPAKSTYFTPKVRSGLFLRLFR